MNLRPRLTYANVVATLALVLALGGGTVYAATKLGKNEVKSKNIAPGAVKGGDLHKDAVTGPKVKDGTIAAGDLAKGVIRADVTAKATAGPQDGLTSDTPAPLPLKGKTTITPRPGEVAAIAAEGRFSVASSAPPQFCQPAVFLLVNGEPTRVFVSPEQEVGNTATLTPGTGRDADGPFGLLTPGKPLTVTAQIRGDTDCTADSKLDRLQVRILQFK
jgi:hypothetical protein